MRVIGVDMHVVDGGFQGTRTHVLELFSEVIHLSPDLRFVLFLANTDLLTTFSPLFTATNVELVHMPHANPIKRLCWQLPQLQKKYRLDILHTQYILPFPSFSMGMVTIHDVLFETHPQYFEPLFRLRSTLLMRLSAWCSTQVFTVSEFSKQAMQKHYRIAPEKISVIHNGVDENRFYPGNAGAEIITGRGLTSKGYLLTVGRLEPRKNHVTLLRAYARLSSPPLPLVIIGHPHFGFDEVFEVIKELQLENQVIILSNVKDTELPAFYRHAKLFLYPSWAEGFGMPPLEAMASGVPVVCSGSTSIPEVVGDAAVLFNPDDVDALVNAINYLLSDQDFYHEIQSRGLKQVKKFQWTIAAKAVRARYLAVLSAC